MPGRHEFHGSFLLQYMASYGIASHSHCSVNSHPTLFRKGAKPENRDQNPRPAEIWQWQNSHLIHLQRPKQSRFLPSLLRFYLLITFAHHLIPPSTTLPNASVENYHLESFNVTQDVLGRRNEIGGRWDWMTVALSERSEPGGNW